MTAFVPAAQEFHLSLRVADLDASTQFYTGLFGLPPKELTARYATFIVPHLALNFVLLVNDKGAPLDTYSLYHLGLGVTDKAAVIESYHRALARGRAEIVKPPRTTWRGTPLHELWLRDPTGYLIEIYARLTEAERAAMSGGPGACVPGAGRRAMTAGPPVSPDRRISHEPPHASRLRRRSRRDWLRRTRARGRPAKLRLAAERPRDALPGIPRGAAGAPCRPGGSPRSRGPAGRSNRASCICP